MFSEHCAILYRMFVAIVANRQADALYNTYFLKHVDEDDNLSQRVCNTMEQF